MFKALLAPPPGPSTVLTTYTTINGAVYMSTGVLFWLYPYALELFGSPKLTDDVAGYTRGIGIAVIQIGWFYLWGARTRSVSFCLSTIVNRFFGPVLILPLVFMKLLEPALGIPFVVIDLVLATGAFIIWNRTENK
ncbi:MAG TPA: hypothetical protein PKY30_20335 [Myxococcota bacterium]|jgi:hypothetical protein|nr:hypothetical protein [Myxococcota bacterium]